MSAPSNLVSSAVLIKWCDKQTLKILDASWYLPTQGRNPRAEYAQQHIPTAQYFDIDAVCDQHSTLPHMLPSANDFATAVGNLGISNSDTVVVYDTAGLFSAARAWWMFKVFGHQQVFVLNGGFPAWLASGGIPSHLAASVTPANYLATLNPHMVANLEALQDNLITRAATVIDARPRGRFLGREPEPRAGLAAGHIPNSVSIPISELLNDGILKPKSQLKDIFRQAGVDETTNVITSCGSGVTAAVLTLALAECGFGLQRLYDGAWSEWAASNNVIAKSL